MGQSKFRETLLTQGNVRINCDLTHLLQRQLYFWGSYEKEYCQLWIKFSRTANTIFDVGANVGLYSLLSAAAKPGVAVHAFEPTPEILDRFKENIRLNGFKNIHVNQTAVGRSSGTAVLRECYGSDGANEGMNFIVGVQQDSEPKDRVVPIVSLDDYCRKAGVDQIDLLKMDIEGGECEALTGAQDLLRSGSIRCLFVEFAEWASMRSNHTLAELAGLLSKSGYSMYSLHKSKLQLIEQENPPDNANILAFSPNHEVITGRPREIRI